MTTSAASTISLRQREIRVAQQARNSAQNIVASSKAQLAVAVSFGDDLAIDNLNQRIREYQGEVEHLDRWLAELGA